MCLYPVTIWTKPKVGERRKVTVKCGKCLECARQASIEWAFRIVLEARQYNENCMLTLTYNNDNLPQGGVDRREVQLFMKSLRQSLSPRKVRFFACGEYGKRFSRPHYHIIIFGWFPEDSYEWCRDSSGIQLYRSPQLEKVWKKGFSSVGKLTYKSALYCAKYLNKIQYNNELRLVKRGLNSVILPNVPFVQMSNRPGIGFNAVCQANLDTDRIYIDGKSTKIPRYFLKVMERDGIYLDDFKALREAQGAMVEKCTDIEIKRKKAREFETSFSVLKKTNSLVTPKSTPPR